MSVEQTHGPAGMQHQMREHFETQIREAKHGIADELASKMEQFAAKIKSEVDGAVPEDVGADIRAAGEGVADKLEAKMKDFADRMMGGPAEGDIAHHASDNALAHASAQGLAHGVGLGGGKAAAGAGEGVDVAVMPEESTVMADASEEIDVSDTETEANTSG